MNAPQSPQAIALGKFAEVPVNLYTGQPNISIPLYTLQVKGIQVPVSLSYNSSGIKVKDIPGAVGLGWSLNAGGVITRVVMGYPDDHELINGNPQHNDADFKQARLNVKKAYPMSWESTFNEEDRHRIVMNTPGISSEPSNSDLYKLYTQKIDTEIDFYYFNFMGFTGQFTFTNEGKPFVISGPEGLKIEYINKRYLITDPNGIQYFFDAVEKAFDQEEGGGSMYVNSWYLTKVYSPVQQQTINFSYTDYQGGIEGNPSSPGTYMTAFSSTISRLMFLSERATITSGAPTIPTDPKCTIHSMYATGPGLVASQQYRNILILKEISWDDTRISFMGSLGRNDIYQYKLDSIIVLNGDELRDKIRFSYGYFNPAASDPGNKKLKLTEVSINDQRYGFRYFESLYGKQVPGILAKGQDIWGYYNGEDDEEAIPRYQVLDVIRDQVPEANYGLPDANSTIKNPDENFSRLGSLSEMIYPTGGKIAFEYEGNDYSKVGFENGLLASSVQNYYTNMVLEDTRSKDLRVDTDPPNTTEMLSKEREFIVHEQQQLTLSTLGGFNYQRYQTMDYQTYMTSIYEKQSWTNVVFQKYNESSGAFEDIVNNRIFPGERIGPVYSQGEFQSKRTAGLITSSQAITLVPGRYKIKVIAQGWYMAAAIAGLNIKLPYKKSTEIYKGAGIRIKSFKLYSNGSNIPELVKNYSYKTAQGHSSGVLEAPFGNLSISGYVSAVRDMGNYSYQSGCYFANMTSETATALGNAQGGVIGYASVTESRDDNSKTTYSYTTSLDNGAAGGIYADSYIDETAPVFNKTHVRVKEDNSWKRGLLKSTNYYNAGNNLVQQVFHDYNFYTEDANTATSLIITNIRFSLSGLAHFPYPPPFTAAENYYIRYGRHALKTLDSVVQYTTTGTISDVKRYEYRPLPLPHTFPVVSRHITSTGAEIITNTNYPQDYTVGTNPVNPTAQGIKKLVDMNIINQPIETWVQKRVQSGSTPKTISGIFNQFRPQMPLPEMVFAIRTSSGLLNYQPVQVTAGERNMNSAYEPALLFLNYDNYGNLLEQAKAGNTKEVYLWGYHHRYPVARIIGADYTAVANLVDHQILNEPTSEEQLLQELNKIRTALANTPVQVYTYSYIPLKGISVEIDPAGRKTSYIYDSQGRLIMIKDQNGNIIKMICYNYQGQPETCNN
jgi:YD repeat-containing protein